MSLLQHYDTQVSGNSHFPTRATKAVLVLSGSMTIMGSVMVAPVIPQIIKNFATEDGVSLLVQLAITGPALAISIFSPLAGMLADRFGRIRLLMLATFLYALLGAAPYLIGDLTSLVAVRVSFGLAEAVVMTCCMTLIGDYWKDGRRLGVINLQVITIGLIGTALYLVGGWIGQENWRLPFLLYLIPLVLIPLMRRFLREPQRPSASPGLVSAHVEEVDFVSLTAGYVCVFFGMVLAFIVPIQSPFLLMDIGINSTLDFAKLSAWALFISLAGSLAWPLLHRKLGVGLTHAVTFALMALSIFLMCQATTYAEMFVAVTFHGIACGLFPPNTMAPVMAALTDRTRARGMGGFTSLLYFGQFLSPVVVATLIPQSGGVRASLEILAVMAALYACAWALAAIAPALKRKNFKSRNI